MVDGMQDSMSAEVETNEARVLTCTRLVQACLREGKTSKSGVNKVWLSSNQDGFYSSFSISLPFFNLCHVETVEESIGSMNMHQCSNTSKENVWGVVVYAGHRCHSG